MRAYVLRELGAEPALTNVPDPVPEPDEVLVRVAGSSVNPHDAMVSSGAAARYLTYELPAILGTDFSGAVEAVGSEVDDLAVGDRVFGLLRELQVRRGTFAELVAVPRMWVARTPDQVSDEFAGTIGLAALTALRCVEAAPLAPGSSVLVNGATGGVGSYVTQMLTARGMEVVATAGAGLEEEHVRDMGAAIALDWRRDDLPQCVRESYPAGVDAIIDLVNRDASALATLAAAVLATGGWLVSTGHAAEAGAASGWTVANIVATADETAMAHIAGLVAEGMLRPAVSQTFDLPDIAEALALLRNGAVGKVAIRV